MTFDMTETSETPQAYPRLRTWVSGLAVGLVAATFAWVQVVPDAVETQAAGSGGGGAFLPADPDAPVEGGEGQEATGSQTRVIERQVGGEAAETGGGGGVQIGDGVSSGESAGGGEGGTTGNRILLGATVAEGGIAKDFLGEVRHGMNAVATRVNSAGGIHGRQLEIEYKNDNWDPGRGRRNIETLMVQDEVFAFAVSPSSEGLNAASNAGLFERHGVPVIGADGLNNTQFQDPWIWPVAAATTTQVHVIMKDAQDRCKADSNCSKLEPAIVFGNTYRFGVEGAFAFNGAYCRLTGGTFTGAGECRGGDNVPGFTPGGTSCNQGSRFCGVDANKRQFPNEISTVNDACRERDGHGACNFVLLLLEPSTALSWMGGDFPSASEFERDGRCCGVAGAQPLFTSNFAVECGDKCDRMRVWTGYNPPIGRYQSDPAVQRYSQELEAQSSRADVSNQFTLGGYIGMTLLVEAIERVGPDLTRAKLVETLNSMPPLKTGLTNPGGLRWTADKRYANDSAQSFRIDFRNRFNGFQEETGYTEDPWLGKDNRLP